MLADYGWYKRTGSVHRLRWPQDDSIEATVLLLSAMIEQRPFAHQSVSPLEGAPGWVFDIGVCKNTTDAIMALGRSYPDRRILYVPVDVVTSRRDLGKNITTLLRKTHHTLFEMERFDLVVIVGDKRPGKLEEVLKWLSPLLVPVHVVLEDTRPIPSYKDTFLYVVEP